MVLTKPRPVITFTGGLGAQILSAALYLDLESAGHDVAADLRYFSLTPREASHGSKEVSIWPWVLDEYGLPMRRFREAVPRRFIDDVIADGPRKMALAAAALRRPNVRRAFAPISSLESEIQRLASNSVVLHVRRGDYLNVADYVVPDEDVLEIARQMRGHASSVIVLSDSPLSAAVIQGLDGCYEVVIDGAGLTAIEAHSVMRSARVLVACNSQFSLTAGLLRDAGLTVIPNHWVGARNSELDEVIHGMSTYSILSLKSE